MKHPVPIAVALVALTGCAAMQRAEDPAAEVRAARFDAEMDQRALRGMEDQNRLLVAELAAERATAVERAELSRRIDELTRANEKLAQAVAKIERDDCGKGERPRGAAPAKPIVDTTDAELSRLRAKLAESGFGPVTLTPEQVRALLRALRPPRPIDPDSPFSL
jgi:hypothetical protein